MVRQEHICWACSQKTSAGPLLIHDLQINLVRCVWPGYAAYHSASGNRVNKYFFQHRPFLWYFAQSNSATRQNSEMQGSAS